MSHISVYSYTHSVTYVVDNILKSFNDIITLTGLNPTNFTNDWRKYSLALTIWISSSDLERITLEIYNPTTDKLILRWDLEVYYNWTTSGEGNFFTDTEQLKYNICKAGIVPSEAKYNILMHTKKGRPNVEGWGSGELRSTEGMIKQSLGSTIDHNGLSANAAYWRAR